MLKKTKKWKTSIGSKIEAIHPPSFEIKIKFKGTFLIVYLFKIKSEHKHFISSDIRKVLE
jgi:hypothetical protein